MSRRIRLDLSGDAGGGRRGKKRRTERLQGGLFPEEAVLGQQSLEEFGMMSTLTRQKSAEIEWWDEPLLKTKSYMTFGERMDEFGEGDFVGTSGPSSSLSVSSSSTAERRPAAGPIFQDGYWKRYYLGGLMREGASPFVEGSVSGKLTIPPHIGSAAAVYMPTAQMVELTKKERKKIRRDRRMKIVMEMQEKVRTGELPPPPPKVKLSNLHRVYTEQMVATPTELAKLVREEERRRRAAHEERNQARKLTKEERREKEAEKIRAAVKRSCIAALFRFVCSLVVFEL
jgi:hypothetical protein